MTLQVTMLDIISLAVEKAAHWHRDQVDKSGEAYILHPLRVMFLARERGLSPNYQAAAVMHDLLEDTHFSEVEMRSLFPSETCDAVIHLTRRKQNGETYEQFIERIAAAPIDVIELKLCDLDDNMSPSRATTEKLRALVHKRYRPTRMKLADAMARRIGA